MYVYLEQKKFRWKITKSKRSNRTRSSSAHGKKNINVLVMEESTEIQSDY